MDQDDYEDIIKEEEEHARVTIEWMWNDAGLPIPGFGALAALNPLRWTKGSTTEAATQLLQEENQSRPVKLRIEGDSYFHIFPNAKSAAAWIRSCEGHEERPTPGSLLFSAFGDAATFVAAPALAVFCRANCEETPWPANNMIAASMYALRVTKVPMSISEEQHVHADPTERGDFVRYESTWEEYKDSGAMDQSVFLWAASKPEAHRPDVINSNGELWKRNVYDRDHPNTFWAVYEHKTTALVAFRGGDGGTQDAKRHIGSPARAYVQGKDAGEVPQDWMPCTQLEHLGKQGYTVFVLGYSQGGIPALACSLMYCEEPWLAACTLFNCATMFWPVWMQHLLPEKWWIEGDERIGWRKIQSWLVRDDPLSDGIPGGKVRAPQTPGTTIVLPTKATGAKIIENHSLKHFLPEEYCQ